MNVDRDKYKIYDWKNGMMLHWLLNPGLAINELILGQRIPKSSLEDKTLKNKARYERIRVPCPHCKTLHDGRTWSIQNGTAFKNWFGLYCTSCGNIIPCLTNIFSLLILTLTFPIWGWFRKSLKAKWLERQPKRYENINLEIIRPPFKGRTWIKIGLNWGAFMFVAMSIAYPLIIGETITSYTLLLGLVIWTIAGLLFGYLLKSLLYRTVN